MPHSDGHWVESKVNPGWYYGFGKNNPNPINMPAPEPGMEVNITNRTEYDRNVMRQQSGNQTRGFNDDLGFDDYNPDNMNNPGNTQKPNPANSFSDDLGFDEFNLDSTAGGLKVYGTDRPYSGKTVNIGGHLYTTRGGALEGDSLQLYGNGAFSDDLGFDDLDLDRRNGSGNMNQQRNQTSSNPVTRTFVSRVVYYRQDGTVVPSGSELHQHADGTIMLGHDPENMGAIVTRTRPSTRTRTRTTSRTRTSTGGMGSGRRTRTSGGGMSGGGRSGY
tara:strand:+ start:111 stop:935 length:825 start_codon:yes stop_codon:yes gene_type:complete